MHTVTYICNMYVYLFTLCAHWCTHFSARRRRHISKTHFCQGGYVNEDAKTHFEDTLNEDEFPPEDELPREDTFRRHIKRRRIPPEDELPHEDTLNEDEFPPEDELPSEDTFRRHIKRRRISHRRRITPRRHIKRRQKTRPAPGAFLLPYFQTAVS